MVRFKRIASAVGVCAIFLGGLTTATVASADDKSDLQAQQQQQEEELESLQSSLEGVDTDLQEIYIQLEETKTQIPIAESELKIAQSELAEAERDQQSVAAQLDAAQAELADISDAIAQGQEELETTRNNLGEIARSHYRGESVPSTMDILMGSDSTDDFLNYYAASEALTRSQSATLTEVEQASAQNLTRQARQKDVESQISDLLDQAKALVSEKADKESAAEQKASDLVALKESYESQSQTLASKKSDFQTSISGLEDSLDETEAAIAQIDKENAAAAAAAAANSSNNSNGSSGSNSSGSWIIPVVPAPLYVTSSFGMRDYPFGGYWMHNGVDLRSTCGEAQVAPANGTIAKVIPAAGNSTHGNQIYINLGVVNGSSWVAVTNHLSAFNVSVGQKVKQGDVIGWTGQTGQVTGCHVHMEVWKNGSVIDPMSLPGFTRRN